MLDTIMVIGLNAGRRLSDEATIREAFGSPQQIGRIFLTDLLLAFEITSIVLLVAAVGGVILGWHEDRDRPETAA